MRLLKRDEIDATSLKDKVYLLSPGPISLQEFRHLPCSASWLWWLLSSCLSGPHALQQRKFLLMDYQS